MTSDSHMNGHTAFTDQIREEAVRWVLRQRDDDMSESDWVGLTEWLEANTQHLEAYDLALEADDDLGVIAPSVTPVESEDGSADNDNARGGIFSRWPAFGAVAAVLMAAIIFWPTPPSSQFATLQTEVGEIREIAINSSVTMVMNGNTELALDKKAATVRMLRGEASYNVDSPTPGALRIEIEDLVLVDYGTMFNVVRDDDLLRVAVTEGAVMIDPDDQKILISAGEQINMDLQKRSVERSAITADTVFAWRDQQLVFEDKQVESVIADVERNFGTIITLSDQLKDQKITGVINLANDEAMVINDVAAVLGSTARKTQEGWRIGD